MRVFLAVICCLVFAVAACGDDDEPTNPADDPAGHTVFEDGVPHAPGLALPAQNCTQCHGADLLGGANGEPSCFSCHGRLWP